MIFEYLKKEILPLANHEADDTLWSFNLTRAIDWSRVNGCSNGCTCTFCCGLTKFETWAKDQPYPRPTFTAFLAGFLKTERDSFEESSRIGFIDKTAGKIHAGLTGPDFTEETLGDGAVTCQGLFDNDFEPAFLCLHNQNLTRLSIKDIATGLVNYIQHQRQQETVMPGSRFGDKKTQLGSEVLGGFLKSQILTKVKMHNEVKEQLIAKGISPDTFPKAESRLMDHQDQIVWLGKDDGGFEEELSDDEARKQVAAYLQKVGVYSSRVVTKLDPLASEFDILGRVKLIFGIQPGASKANWFASKQPNIFSTGDPLLWVGRKPEEGGQAVFLVDQNSCTDSEHEMCTCGAPAAFEAVTSLKAIRRSNSTYDILNTCYFGSDELSDYGTPPLDTIRERNAA